MTRSGADLPPVPGFSVGRLPRIRFGPGELANLGDIVAAHGRRVLLVTGRRSLGDDRRASLSAGLAGRGVRITGEERMPPEPSPTDVDEAVARHRSLEPDVVLAVGGGSAIDAGKAIAALLRTGTSALDHLEGIGSQLPYPGPAVPLVAVPTTAGTGSEATRNAVLTERGARGFKRSFRDERLVAADAIVDPDLLEGAPRDLIAANGLDAISQLLESYVSLRAGPVTDTLALAGIERAPAALLAWHADPTGPSAPAARSRMAWAALLSGICLAHAGLGVAHGLASPLGAFFPVPHGVACGLVLATGTAANVRALEEREPASPALDRYATLGRTLARLPSDATDNDARAALLEVLRDLVQRLELPGLSAYGLTVGDVDRVVADSRGSSMRTNPIVLTDEELAGVLRAAL